MVIYRCPTSSTISSRASARTARAAQQPGPSHNNHRQYSHPDVQPRKKVSSVNARGNPAKNAAAQREGKMKGMKQAAAAARASQTTKAATAASAAQEAEHERHIRNLANFATVYVGNIRSDLDEADVAKFFEQCGKIILISMRASLGICVPTKYLPKPRFGKKEEGRHYAVVTFADSNAAWRAMNLDGGEMGGQKVVVGAGVHDMPESMDILKESFGLGKTDDRSWLRKKWGRVKRLTIEKTELVIDVKPKPTKGRPTLTRQNAFSMATGVGVPEAMKGARMRTFPAGTWVPEAPV